MNEFIIVAFLIEPIPTVFKRAAWPLHTTLLIPFSTKLSAAEVQGKMCGAVADTHPLLTLGKSREMFGRNFDTSVTELTKTPELAKLHMKLVEAFKAHATFKSPDWIGANYRPHVTDTPNIIIEPGQEVTLNTISLVELSGEEGRVLYTLGLGRG